MTQPSVNELRRILVESGKYTQEQADNIKGKSKLSELVLELGADNDVPAIAAIFDSLELETSKVVKEAVDKVFEDKQEENDIPTRLDAGWQDYVLAQFKPEELDNGYPKIIGLRRVAQKLIGPIISSLPTLLNTVVDERNPSGRTSCIYEITFAPHDTIDFSIKYGAAASAWIGNTDDDFAAFTEAIAEVRAESRALRKALNLNIVSQEETTTKNVKEIVQALQTREVEKSGDWQEDDSISVSQELMIKKTTERLGVDLGKLLTKENLGELNELTKKQAIRLIDLLNQYQNSSKESVAIPEEIKKAS
jgi:hypothetical protein